MADKSILEELRARIDEEVSRSEASSEDIKEVYARFGLAYYQADVLHRGLCNFYCLSQLPPSGPVTGARVEEHLQTAFQSTLGQMITRLESVLPPALLSQLTFAQERRNFLAHYFWFERAVLMGSVTGIKSMLDELAADTELFMKMDRELEKLSDQLHQRLGMTSKIMNQAVLSLFKGEEESLLEQRKPKKEETIVAIFIVPAESGQKILIFQSEDGVMWQFCDAGLGWTSYQQADASWLHEKDFDGLLPARINPRPQCAAPWNFDIKFGAHAVISVRPGKRPGQVVYRLDRSSKANKSGHGLKD